MAQKENTAHIWKKVLFSLVHMADDEGRANPSKNHLALTYFLYFKKPNIPKGFMLRY